MNFFKRLQNKAYEFYCKAGTRLYYRTSPEEILSSMISSHDVLKPGQLEDVKDQKILVLVPFKDKWDLTRSCLNSLLSQNLPQNIGLKVILINNNSEEECTLKGVAEFQSRSSERISLKCLNLPIPINFSKKNTLALEKYWDPSFQKVLLLNNDIEILDKNALAKMASVADSDQGIAAVGSTLLFPDRTIQHLFVFPGSKIVGSHPFRAKDLDKGHKWFQRPQRVPAITGALVLIDGKTLMAVGGFDDELPNCYQDVDLCLKLQKAGAGIAVVPDMKIIHYETQTRKPVPHWREVRYIYNKWGDFLTWNPKVPKLVSRSSEALCFDGKHRKYPWWRLYQ